MAVKEKIVSLAGGVKCTKEVDSPTDYTSLLLESDTCFIDAQEFNAVVNYEVIYKDIV